MSIELADRPDLEEADPLGRLAELIRTRHARTAVIGLGYVGLPLLVALAEAGFPTIGLDTDPVRIRSLLKGRSYISYVTDSGAAAVAGHVLSTDPDVLRHADVVVICVPTPLTDHTPDLSMVRRAGEDVALRLRPGRLVILESTTYPGTTEAFLRPILEASGLRAGVEFALAYSPERIDPGQRMRGLSDTPKIVAGLTARCRDVAAGFYSAVVGEVVTTSSPREAEMAKLIENIYRQVNIALVNELAILAAELDVDIWEAIGAASTKPFGFQTFWPGPGVGGHCISIDPSYLSWRAGQQLGYRLGFIEHANGVNNRMPAYVVARISEALNERGKPVRGSRILALGAAYKAGVEDVRLSPSLEVMQRLIDLGATVAYHDPFVPEVALQGQHLRSVTISEETIGSQDCVVILTAHPDLDYPMILRAAPLVFDSRGVTAGTRRPNLVRL